MSLEHLGADTFLEGHWQAATCSIAKQQQEAFACVLRRLSL